jgi:N-acetylneuraminate synthase/sialic acid synthase
MIKMGKKVVAARDLRADERITREDLELRSPGDGMSPELLECIVGRYLLRDIRQGEDLRQDDFGPVPKP